jgi:hypothetical protein
MATPSPDPAPTPPGFHAWLAGLAGVVAILLLLFILTGLSGTR